MTFWILAAGIQDKCVGANAVRGALSSKGMVLAHTHVEIATSGKMFDGLGAENYSGTLFEKVLLQVVHLKKTGVFGSRHPQCI